MALAPPRNDREPSIMSYAAPIADIRFALEGAADLWSVRRKSETFAELDENLLDAILAGAGALAEHTLAPLNRSGDEAGVSLENDVVTTAPGFKQAYKDFANGGWLGLAADPLYGGQGLPRAVSLATMEMMHAANM